MDTVNWQNLDKEERIKQLILLKKKNSVSFPSDYFSNEVKEDLILEYVNRFNQQFKELCPKRNKLLLSPYNELLQEKFLSTFIKPTILKFPSLYDYESCAKFLKNYITYEKLKKPFEVPRIVQSPTTTLSFQKGDCFDLSVLLTSFLIGSGYDAYCVMGYAKEIVTERQLFKKIFPLEKLNLEEKKVEVKKKQIKSKYKLKKRPMLETNFEWIDKDEKGILKILSEQKKKEEEEKEKLEREKNARLNNKVIVEKKLNLNDCAGKHRIHCWVLVLPGKRDITSPFFIEPSTSEIIYLSKPLKQKPVPKKEEKKKISKIKKKEKKEKEVKKEIENTEDLLKKYLESKELLKNYLQIESCWNDKNYWINMLNEMNEDEGFKNFNLQDKEYWENVIITDEKENLGVVSGEENDDVLDLPISWVKRIRLSNKQFQSMYPGKHKVSRYQNVEIELFAPYSTHNLLTKKITVFRAPEYKDTKEIHFLFSHRKDCVSRRSIYYHYLENNEKPTEKKEIRVVTKEFFRNRDDSLLEIEVNELEDTKTFKFASKGKLDGCSCRKEYYLPKQLYELQKKNKDEFYFSQTRINAMKNLLLIEMSCKKKKKTKIGNSQKKMKNLKDPIALETNEFEKIFEKKNLKEVIEKNEQKKETKKTHRFLFPRKVVTLYENRKDFLFYRSVTYKNYYDSFDKNGKLKENNELSSSSRINLGKRGSNEGRNVYFEKDKTNTYDYDEYKYTFSKFKGFDIPGESQEHDENNPDTQETLLSSNSASKTDVSSSTKSKKGTTLKGGKKGKKRLGLKGKTGMSGTGLNRKRKTKRTKGLKLSGTGKRKDKETAKKEERIVPKTIKMLEKFNRNPELDADEDIQKIVYHPHKIRIDFHYGDNKITHMSREYMIDGEEEGRINVDGADPFLKRLKKEDYIAELNELKEKEKECNTISRNEMYENYIVLVKRKEEDKKRYFTTTIYDTLMNNAYYEENKE